MKYILIFGYVYLPCSLFTRIGKQFFHNNKDINITQQYLFGIKTIESKINV